MVTKASSMFLKLFVHHFLSLFHPFTFGPITTKIEWPIDPRWVCGKNGGVPSRWYFSWDLCVNLFFIFLIYIHIYIYKSSSKSRSEFLGQILILVRFGANKFLVCSLIYMCFGLVVKMVISFAHTPIFVVLLILGLE